MAWRRRPVSILLGGNTAGMPSTVGSAAIVVVILSAACLALLLTAPVNGDFWWSDDQNHALNGALFNDFIAAHPIHRPVRWVIDYYLRRPALTIIFYPQFLLYRNGLIRSVRCQPFRGPVQHGELGIDILRPTYPAAAKSGRTSIEMPLAGQRFEGSTHP